ncbi:MAG: response regulator [Actinobacteria bacterium]|nr:response regulator [Actinomycetota bacterium]
MSDDIRNSKILIVEDDADNVHLLELFFETSGFTDVHATSDARSVEALVRKLDPDLLLLDLHMPHVDGLEVMRRVQEAVPEHEIPMIVMSGDISPENRRIGAEMGATDFLGKPYEMSALLHKVEQALGASKTSAQQNAE